MPKRPGHVNVTTEVGYCPFCTRARNLRREDHIMGALMRSTITCETCHRTLSSTMGSAETLELAAEAADSAPDRAAAAPDPAEDKPSPVARAARTSPKAAAEKPAPKTRATAKAAAGAKPKAKAPATRRATKS
jgi:septal ring-binding cell division protein DamX